MRSKRGITLISLVVTIIVLLILATVAINLAVNSEGLFTKAGEAANGWNSSVAEEGDTLGDLFTQLDNVSPMPVSISEEVPEDWNEGVTKVAVTGNRQVPIPEGFTVSGVEEENTISGGLVIYETDTTVTEATHETALTEYNQYVWIPVDNINDMVMCKAHGAAVTLDEETLECPTCKAANTETRLAGKLYSSTNIVEYSTAFDSKATGQEFIDDSWFREPDDLIGNYGDAHNYAVDAIKVILNNNTATTYDEIKEEWNDLLKTDFENMAKSVAKYKGFYISRYEVGENGTSKKGQSVVTEKTQMWYGLFSLLRSEPEVVSTTYSQMIWGSQYDQLVKFIGEEAQIAHSDRNLTINFAVSGNNPLDKMKNIYDLEGNYLEWTAEAYNTTLRTARGFGSLQRSSRTKSNCRI